METAQREREGGGCEPTAKAVSPPLCHDSIEIWRCVVPRHNRKSLVDDTNLARIQGGCPYPEIELASLIEAQKWKDKLNIATKYLGHGWKKEGEAHPLNP